MITDVPQETVAEGVQQPADGAKCSSRTRSNSIIDGCYGRSDYFFISRSYIVLMLSQFHKPCNETAISRSVCKCTLIEQL